MVKDVIKYLEIEVIYLIFNYKGIGIVDGIVDEMVEVIK